MLPYWALFGTSALAAVTYVPKDGVRRPTPALVLFALMIILMVGLRYKVGADWINYLGIYQRAGLVSFDRLLSYGDVAFQTLNWLGREWDLRIWFVNLVCAVFFGWGLYKFSRLFQNPYLALAIAIPYVVVAVAMGYTRQGAALGFVMAALSGYIRDENAIRFAVLIFLGSLFHSSAVVIFPLVMLTAERSRLTNLLVVLSASYVAYISFARSASEKIRAVYLDPAYASQGAWVRVLMDVTAAAVFVTIRNSPVMSRVEAKIWRNFSLAAVATLVALLLVRSSTLVDRLAIYLLPLQIAMFSRMTETQERRQFATIAVIGLFAFVFFVWSNFGANSAAWNPYRAFFVWE